jgi:hypothetical protein
LYNTLIDTGADFNLMARDLIEDWKKYKPKKVPIPIVENFIIENIQLTTEGV